MNTVKKEWLYVALFVYKEGDTMNRTRHIRKVMRFTKYAVKGIDKDAKERGTNFSQHIR